LNINKGHFALDAERNFLPYLANHWNRENETWHVVLVDHKLHALQICWKTISNERHFTLEAEIFLHSYIHFNRNGFTQTSHVALTALRYEQCKFGTNLSVMKGTLLKNP
jgi:hypothetical protein